MKKTQKILIGVLSFIIVTMILFVVFIMNGNSSNSRTVMIYMAGSDLESRSGIATSDISSILQKNIDLENNHILIYSGGTKKWFNFMDPNENAIYSLTKDGFKKVKSYDKSSLGESSNFSEFLTYGYNTYKTDEYDLIFWNHGLGVMGSIMDENSKDYLDLVEINEALEKSPFNKNNKLETILYRTCLNGTLEMAYNISDYANYMVASEEITLGSNETSVLDFLNNIDKIKDGYDFGIKFIDSYKKQIDELNYFGEPSSTYSIINLNNVGKLVEKFDAFISKIDVNKYYPELVRLRADLNQYAVDTYGIDDYDTVDLNELITSLSNKFKIDSKDLLNYLNKEVVLYNWATNDYSNGLSIYYPYSASDKVKQKGLDLYKKIKMGDNYKKFISTFNGERTSSKYTFAYNLDDNEMSINEVDDEFKLKLSEEEINNYASSFYYIFMEQEDGYMMPIYSYNDAKIVDGYLVTNINDGLIKYEDDDGDEFFFNMFGIKTNNEYKEFTGVATLWKMLEGDHFYTNFSGKIHLRVDKDNNVYVDEVLVDSDISSEFTFASGASYKLEDFDKITLYNFSYKVTDENGNFNYDWGYNNVKKGFEKEGKYKENYNFKLASIKNEKGNFYSAFVIKDLQGKEHYSKLIKIN